MVWLWYAMVIWTHCLGDLISDVEPTEIDWVYHHAFSDSVLLDHKPIHCMIGTEDISFIIGWILGVQKVFVRNLGMMRLCCSKRKRSS